MIPRPKVIWPIFRRNLASYFAGVLGYLFIVVFVVAGGAMTFNARFFTANEPSLDQLTQWFPLLLLFFVPAITTSVWADERKTGTDELLFTMPATDVEILLGKYFSVLTVYSVALLFSMTHVLVLMFLGTPDWGLICTTYFGHWIAGAALDLAGVRHDSYDPDFVFDNLMGGPLLAIQPFLSDVLGYEVAFPRWRASGEDQRYLANAEFIAASYRIYSETDRDKLVVQSPPALKSVA